MNENKLGVSTGKNLLIIINIYDYFLKNTL